MIPPIFKIQKQLFVDIWSQLRHRHPLVNFTKFLKTLALQNTPGRLIPEIHF